MERFKHSTRSVHVRVLTLHRNAKKLVMVLADLLALPLALWSAYALRLADWWPASYLVDGWLLFALVPVAGVLIFARLGLYRAVVRFMGVQAITAVCKGVALLALVIWGAAYLAELSLFPRSLPIIFALVALVYVGGSRLLVRNYYHWLSSRYVEKERVLIYGAGNSGAQLAIALTGASEYLPVGFLDDDRSLWKSTVTGLPVYPPDSLGDLIDGNEITQVLLALPSVGIAQRRRILESLSAYPVRVKTVPTMAEIIAGTEVNRLRDVDPEDLLGRDPVLPDNKRIGKGLTGKSVMVTGAGGSIGSELCRQILRHRPKTLVLFEQSEFSLYSIERELKEANETEALGVSIYPLLGSVVHRRRCESALRAFGVDTVYHAAAYKHVPLVEHNVIEGVQNNVFGTWHMAEAAISAGVQHFVLISTDKAVRPTNIMGASKRMAELVLQGLAERQSRTIFSMVRFGNVLGSSGSVVPLFWQQIKNGGPVTVTHPEIIRYFMTIPEASQLVLQAGCMAEGGEVFVLDMGEPVKIIDLARKMIHLMGFEEKSERNPDGDIEIIYTGLRPGEKLYEELLIGNNPQGTDHPRIMMAREASMQWEDVEATLKQLMRASQEFDCRRLVEILKDAPTGYAPSGAVVDLVSCAVSDDNEMDRVYKLPTA